MKYTIKQYDSGYKTVLSGAAIPYEVSKTDNYALAKMSAVESTINNQGMTCIIVDNTTSKREVWADGSIVFQF